MPPEDSPRPRKCEPLLLKLGVFLLLGAIVNVAVAWGCAVSPAAPRRFLEKNRSNPPCGHFHVWAKDFSNSKSINLRLGDFRAYEFRKRLAGTTVSDNWFDETSYPNAIPKWSRFTDQHWPLTTLWDGGDRRDVDYAERASGWPMYAVRYEWIAMMPGGFNSNPEGSVGLLFLPTDLLPNDFQLDMPWLPIWPGFAINTIFYAAMLWLLWIARRTPGKIRRFIRIRGHRCPACGYQIDSAPGIGPRCSECGAALP